jgi:acyl-CoA synthetase (AMP-forming)/AMP-acid ligase II
VTLKTCVSASSERTLHHEFRSAVSDNGDSVHLICDGSRLSLSQLARASEELGAAFRTSGVQDGSRVLLILPNGISYAVVFFASLEVRATVIPVDPQLTSSELADICRRVQPSVVCVNRIDFQSPFDRCLDELVRDREYLPRLVVSMQDQEFQITKCLANLRHFGERDSMLAEAYSDDAAAIFFTSGASGAPKAVVHTEHSLMASATSLKRLHAAFFSGSLPAQARRVALVLARHGKRLINAMGQQVWYSPLQFSTIAGHEVFLGSLLAGHSLVTTGRFDPRKALHDLADERVNIVALTPAMAEMLLVAVRRVQPRLPSLFVIGLGGDSVAPELANRLRQVFRCAVTIGYGSTELGGGVLATRLEDSLEAQSTTVGKPFPGSKIRIITKDGRDVQPGEIGELLCQTDGAASTRYLSDEAGTTTNDESGWWRTGDLALFDKRRNVRIVGRISDTIIRGGRNVSPLEVEQAIEALAGILECGVVGVSRQQTGQQIWAYIVLEPGASVRVSRRDVQEHCKSVLAPSKRPDHIRFVSSLPRSSNGKLRRFALASSGDNTTDMRHSGGTRRPGDNNRESIDMTKPIGT